MSATHRVRHLEWRARVGSASDAFAVRSQLRRFVETDLMPTLERAFDAVAGDDTIYVSRLELSLRVGDLDQLGSAITQVIERQARTWTRAREALGTDVTARSTPAREPDVVIGVEGFIRYLETGLLPWPLANLGRATTLATLVEIARAQRVAILAAAPASIDASMRFFFRWSQVVPEDEWIEIAQTIEAAWSDRIPGIADAIERVRSRAVQSLRLQMVAAMLAVAVVRGRGQTIDLETVTTRFESIVHGRSAAPFPDDERSAIDRRWSAVGLAIDWIERTIGAPQTTPAAGVTRPAGLKRPALGESAVPPHARGATADARPDAIAVDHAGLVLLHPFLPRLFERTEITRPGDRVIAQETLPRAAALLAFAARGDDDPRDFELPFVKVLLGGRPGDPVLVPVDSLSSRDRGEVDDLLRSVVEHWQVLKHTSIDGLRASFLQRRGLLAEVDEGWRLRVESDGFDVLLQHLPWTLSIAALPWMTRPIFTEWATP